MSKKRKISRRKFIANTGCAAMGSTAFLSSFTTLGMMNSLVAPPPPDDYRALVCILLAGGNDSYNMVVPTTSEPYNVYANTRSNLALPSGSLLPLNYTDSAGINYGLNPAMPEVANMFNSGRAAVIANVGTLIEPVTKAQILAGTAPLPLGLMSHADQSRHWQTSIPQTRSAKGWGGKVADILASGNTNQDMSMNLSLAGTNLWQSGNIVDEFAITSQGSVGINILGDTDPFAVLVGNGITSILDQQYSDILKQTYANKVNSSQNQHDVFTAALDTLSPLSTQFANTQISEQLNMVAKSIAVSGGLGMERQTYYIQLSGFDNHGEVLNNQGAQLSLLSAAIGSFYEAMDELGIAEKVTTFTISDFARTLTSNGSGSDHAWGGNALVFGGAVNGGQIYGQYPSLDLGGVLEVGNGVLIPEISTDQYFAELALWLGVLPSSLPDIFPNVENFYTPGTGNPVGFMNI
ncbi:MAG: hypothetical protein COA49_03920 [Bacteroidetes bacterium]|nr:MAG: hypothetical protein COA49_03920 [Bacteroidota bacterium]